MKKLLLLFAAGVVTVSANAQQLQKTAAPYRGVNRAVATPIADNSFNMTTPATTTGKNKTTLGGSRWYNYVDLLITFGSDPSTNFGRSFMTNQKELAFFGASANPNYDTTFLTSAGVILDPSTAKFNDLGLVPVIGNQIGVSSTNAYTVDSVRFYGEYRRNSAKPNVVDTLRIAITGGAVGSANLPSYRFTGMMANFGYDTVKFVTLNHDTVKNIARGTGVVVKDVYLTAASLTDTAGPGSNFEGLNVWSVATGGISVPANGVVGASVTFISGDVTVGNWDTVQTANGTKINHLSAWFFTEKNKQFQTYTPGDWNVGLSKYNDYYEPIGSGWRGLYVPSYAYTAPVWHENLPMDFKITCATCMTLSQLSVDDVNSNITKVNAYPNPANTEIKIAFALKNATTATVNITNAVGQVLASEKTKNNNVTFSTANLANGIYFYTVESNGQKVTNRFVVAH